MAEFHLNNRQYGWLVSAFSFSYAIAAPAVGWLLDRLGLETGIIWAVGLWSLATAFCGWSRSLGQLIGARVFLGIWESAGVPAAGKLNAIYLEPKNRAMGAAVTQVGLSIAGIGAPLLVGTMAGWRSPFFVCAALGFAWIPVWIAVRRHVRPYEEAPPLREPGAWRWVLNDPRLLALVGANILWMGIYTLWSNWTTIYLVGTFGLTTEAASWYAWVPPVASMLGAFAGGWISRRAINAGMPPVRARVMAALIRRDRMPGNGSGPTQSDTALGSPGHFRQLLLGHGGKYQRVHDTARYLGRPTRGHGHLGTGICLRSIADRNLAGHRKSDRPFRIHAGLLAGRFAAVCRLAAPPDVRSRAGNCKSIRAGRMIQKGQRRPLPEPHEKPEVMRN